MLQAMREKFSGWVLILIVGLLAVPFALFGINNYFQAQVENYVAKVGDEEIEPRSLQDRLEQQRIQMRQMLGEDTPLDFLNTEENKRRIVDALVDEELLVQDARAAGVEVPASKLQEVLLAVDSFKSNGTFDPDLYRAFLRNRGYSTGAFEALLARDILGREISSRLGGSSFVSEAEVDAYLKVFNQTRTFSHLRIGSAEQILAEPVSEDAITKRFEEKKTDYTTPEQIVLEYVELNAAEFQIEAATDEALRESYERQANRFVVPEQRLASHVLVEVATGADAEVQKAALAEAEKLLAEIRGGRSLADVAKEHSDDLGSKATGGDLGWIEKGANDAAFDDALFALKAGEISEPVLGSNGYHIIELREVRAENRKQFEEVRSELLASFESTERERIYNERAGQLLDAIHRDPQSLKGPAEAAGLTLKTTEAFAKNAATGIALNPQVLEEAFGEMVLDRGQTSDLIDITPNHAVAIRVLERIAPKQRELAEVRAQVEAELKLEAQRELLNAQATDLEKRLATEALDTIATALGKTAEKAEAVVRTAANLDPNLLTEVFKLPRPGAAPLRRVIRLNDDEKVLVELSSVVDGDPKTAEQAARDGAKAQLLSQWQATESSAYVKALRQGVEIEIAEDRLR